MRGSPSDLRGCRVLVVYDPDAIPRQHLGLPRVQTPADARAVLNVLARTLAMARLPQTA